MNVYIITWIILLFLLVLELGTSDDKLRLRFFYIGAFAVFFILGFRSEYVGGDTENYCRFFDGKSSMYGTYKQLDESIEHEIGFLWTVRIIRQFGSSHFVFIFISSLLTIFPFFYIIKRDCNLRILPLLLFLLLFRVLGVSMGAFRQNFGVSYLFLAYIIYTSNIENRIIKNVFAVFLLIISCLCHTAMWVAIPLILFCLFIKLKKWLAVLFILVSVVVSVAIGNLFNSAFATSGELMSNIALMARMQMYYETGQFELNEESVSLFRLLPTSLFMCLIIWKNEDRVVRPLPFNCLVIGTCLYNIGISFPLMFRIVYPLILLGMTTSPGNLSLSKNLLQKFLIVFFVLLFMERQFAHFLEYDYSDNQSRMLPYTFIFE